MRILIVDDEAPTRRVFKRILEGAGYDVAEAFNAQAAIQCLSVDPLPDIVLLDIVLGGASDANGWAVAGYMQTTARLKRVQIIIVSGLDVEAIREGARNYVNALSGSALILGKPVEAATLLEMIERLKAQPLA